MTSWKGVIIAHGHRAGSRLMAPGVVPGLSRSGIMPTRGYWRPPSTHRPRRSGPATRWTGTWRAWLRTGTRRETGS